MKEIYLKDLKDIKNKFLKSQPSIFVTHGIQNNFIYKIYKIVKHINKTSIYKINLDDIIFDYCKKEKSLIYIKTNKYIYLLKDTFFNKYIYFTNFNIDNYFESCLHNVNNLDKFYDDIYKFNIYTSCIKSLCKKELNLKLNLERYNFLNINNKFTETFHIYDNTYDYIILENINISKNMINLDINNLLLFKDEIKESLNNFFNFQKKMNLSTFYNPMLSLRNIHKNLWNFYDINKKCIKMNYLMKENIIAYKYPFVIFYNDDYEPSDIDCFYYMSFIDNTDNDIEYLLELYKKQFFRKIRTVKLN